jgi:Thrombospondin type 1 domain
VLCVNVMLFFLAYDITLHYIQCLMLTGCAVDGGWSVWSDWEQCSQSCGSGYKSRSRDCNNPMPQNGGRLCTGDHVETVKCNDRPCPGKLSDDRNEVFRHHYCSNI